MLASRLIPWRHWLGQAAMEFAAGFAGARAVAPEGDGQSGEVFNYRRGDPTSWRENVPSYHAVVYRGVWSGIDLRVSGQRAGVKYEFNVAPGADPRAIRLRYEGIEKLSLRPDGALEIHPAAGWPALTDAPPTIYQETGGQRTPIPGRFALPDDHTCTFEITGTFDPTKPLTIDPEVAWSTYLGGSGDDYGSDITVDWLGNVFVTGETSSTGWVSGGWDTGFGGGETDAFVVKLSSSGGHVWSTYFGGSENDYGDSVATDDLGNVYVSGTTNSSGWVAGGYDTSYGGYYDAFVVKLSNAGSHIWSTYLGGNKDDWGVGMDVDGSGSVYVTGSTLSAGWVAGGWDTSYNGGTYEGDAFVVKLSPNGGHIRSTYLGGSNDDSATGLVVSGSGNIYVTGTTYSAGWLSGGWDTSLSGPSDGFVAKLSNAGIPIWSSYLGGNSFEIAWGVAVNDSGDAYVVGYTDSSNWVSGGWDTSFNGGADAFVVKLSTTGVHLWATYLGGSGNDYGDGVAVDNSGGVYATGATKSSGWVSGGWDTTWNGEADGFLIRLSSTGSHLWSSYLGGGGYDEGYSIALGSEGDLYVAGYTPSSGWVSGGWDTTYNGGDDAFVVRVSGAYSRASGGWVRYE